MFDGWRWWFARAVPKMLEKPTPFGSCRMGWGIGLGIERGALKFVIIWGRYGAHQSGVSAGGWAKGGMEHAGWGGTMDVEWRWGQGAR